MAKNEPLLQQDLSRFWKKLPPGQKFSLALVAAISLVAIPLSIQASLVPTSTRSQAYKPGTETDSFIPPSNPPTYAGPQVTTCKSNTDCAFTLKVKDRDRSDDVTVEVDFLPPGLTVQACTTDHNFLNRQEVSCLIQGKTEREGHFKLLISADDHTGNTLTQVISLIVSP